MKTLMVNRCWTSAYCQQTTLKDEDGKTVEIINSPLKQPKKGTETIELTKNGKKTVYRLNWTSL